MRLPPHPLPFEAGSLWKGFWRKNTGPEPLARRSRSESGATQQRKLVFPALSSPASQAATHFPFCLEAVRSITAFEPPRDLINLSGHQAGPYRLAF